MRDPFFWPSSSSTPPSLSHPMVLPLVPALQTLALCYQLPSVPLRNDLTSLWPSSCLQLFRMASVLATFLDPYKRPLGKSAYTTEAGRLTLPNTTFPRLLCIDKSEMNRALNGRPVHGNFERRTRPSRTVREDWLLQRWHVCFAWHSHGRGFQGQSPIPPMWSMSVVSKQPLLKGPDS